MRTANIAIPAVVLEVVDERAESLGLTRSAYFLGLALADLEQQPVPFPMRNWRTIMKRFKPIT